MPKLAYHITWTTYGTWLPGDARGWIKSNYNGIRSPDRKLELQSLARMAEDAIELTIPQRQLVEETIRQHCTIRNWHLHAVNARTNHVHVVVEVPIGQPLGDIVRSWKTFTARLANIRLGRSGPSWEADYFDRYMRNEQHLAQTIEYVENNPVKAGLARLPADWIWSSAYFRALEGSA